MRKDDDRLVIEPVCRPSLLKTLAGLQPLDEVFPDVDSGLLPLEFDPRADSGCITSCSDYPGRLSDSES